jgi:hypothetical protein
MSTWWAYYLPSRTETRAANLQTVDCQRGPRIHGSSALFPQTVLSRTR